MARLKITVEQAVSTLGRMADDFLFSTLKLKSASPSNQSLPFLQVHTLELVAKCALLHIEQKLESDLLSHNVREMFRRIARAKPEIKDLLPSENSFARYRSIFIVDNGTNQNITLPSTPEIAAEYELAFFIENLTELKYGFNRKFELTAGARFSSLHVNQKWRVLVSATRAIYATDALNSAAITNGLKFFGSDPHTLSELNVYLGIV